ncbi:chemotaxis protein CheW [Duganella phyllosphaerae]|uniref:CheW-like domain protein n=1 Tax=Duganella phyllosphaerae TaxID=762836 RepID=A0A1E7WVZ4_9BURK|nr:chemotaxis protein CheW [Duganella phyllosphaerae]OFA03945.1 CheW-like domain protein [Duganella phyllosphaerae]
MAAVRETAIATVRLAIATVGTVTVGVPVAAVLQALPLAGALHPLPRRQGALCGVAEHAGALVPVVDLARWVDVGEVLNSAPARDKTARILVLGDGRRSIGLRVDAVVGMTDVPAPTRVLHDQDPDEVFDSVVKSDELGRVVSVLDVARMIALAGAWHGGDDSDSTAGGADDAGRQGGGDSGADGAAALLAQGAGVTANTATLYALLAVGDTRVAIRATELAQVVRMPALRPIGPAGGSSSYCSWGERNVAVIDTARLLGLPAAPPPALLAIVEHGDLALGLMVRAALELRMLAAPVTPAGAAVATTVIGEDGAAIEVIDTAALLVRVPEASISRAAAPAGGAATAQRLNSHAYIVFQTDQHHATAIDAIEEILALAAVHVDAHEQLLPTIAWRGQPLPLTDLRPPGTPTPPGCGARIIVARSPDGADAGCTGYVVKQVVLLIPPNTGKLYRMALAGVGLVEFITTGAATEQASYRTMDLARRTTTARLSG